MTIEVVGDGLAGLMLTRRLLADGHQVRLRGDGKSNAPPVGLVHLFAGRSFRRSALDLACFSEAIEYWRVEPSAQEFIVRRSFNPGDRLDRSLAKAEIPEKWRPVRRDESTVDYAPGFAVAAQEFESKLRDEVRAQEGFAGESSVRVLALGARAPELWPDRDWDCSGGRTVEATAAQNETIRIGYGLHLTPFPGRETVVLGGRFSATGPAPRDELEKASVLTGASHDFVSSWEGRRCAPLDHRPVLGWIDPTTFVFFGFGSRALFWLPYCSLIGARALRDPSVEIPAEFHWSRLFTGTSESP